MAKLSKLYTMEEAANHNTRDECWVVIDGKVYDVTAYLDEHPGGDDVLLAATGKDATEDFEDAGHSKSARELLEQFCIGELDEPSSPAGGISELKIFSKQSPELGLWAVSATVVGVAVVALGIVLWRRRYRDISRDSAENEF